MAVAKPTTRKTPAAGKTATAPTTKRAAVKKDELQESEVSRNLRLLRAILDVPAEATATTTKARRPKTPLASTTAKQTGGTKTVPVTRKNGKTLSVKEGRATSEPLQDSSEQKKLAMNSFNQSLKVLSAVVRKRQLNSQRSPEKQETSLGGQDEVDLDAHANCACAALGVLRQTEDTSKDSEDSIRKREQGAILLLEKLISLEMKDAAVAAASRIYEQYWKRRKDENHKPTGGRNNIQLGLPQLSVLSGSLELRKDFETVCTFQSQILRLAILQGAACITNDFVRAVSIATAGSPAAVICTGQQMGHTDKKKAGDDLRTIAQALSKLYTIAVKTKGSSSENAGQALSLYREAFVVRISSWKILERQIDLEQDLWTPLDRALRHFWHKQMQENQTRYEVTKQLVDRMQSHLYECSFNTELPLQLSDFLAQLAEANYDHQEAANRLADLSRQALGSNKLFYQCRLATIQLAGTGLEVNTSNFIDEILRSFESSSQGDSALSSRDLLSVIRLRKFCSERLSITATARVEGQESTSDTACLRLLFAILRFCASQLREVCHDEVKLRRSLYLAVLKTVEAIVDAEKYEVHNEDAVLKEYLDRLDGCSTVLKEVENESCLTDQDDQSTVIHSLRIRQSNVFWRAHLNPRVTMQGPSAIDLAQKSIACLEGIPGEELGKAALGPRLEKLASMHLVEHAPNAAKQVLEQAITHYIRSGALADAVEASLSKQSSKVWTDSVSLASQLGRALHAYNTLFSRDDSIEVLTQYLYDDGTLPEIHRAVLLEHQILYWLRKRPEKVVFEVLFEQARSVLKLAYLPQHYVWRLRFASAFAFHVFKILGLDGDDMMKSTELLLAVQSHTDNHEHAFLKQYEPTLLSLVSLQRDMITWKANTSNKSGSLSCLRSAIEHCSSLIDLDEVVDNHECLLSTLKACTDHAMALHEETNAVICLQLRLHIIQCGVVNVEDEQIDCYTNLAQCQIRLDDLGAAKASLMNASKLLEADERNHRAFLDFHLVSARYHLASSDTTATDACKSHLEQAQTYFQKVWPKDADHSSIKQIERDSVIAKGALLASELAIRTGNLAAANHYGRQAAKISISIWTALEKRKPKSNTPPEDSTMVSLSEGLSKLNITSRQGPNGASSHGVRYWPYLDLHFQSLAHASSMMSHMGLYDDALHYVNQLRQVVSPISCPHPSMSPVPALAILYAKSGRESDAMQLLATNSTSLKDTCSVPVIDDILLCSEAYLALGDVEAARHCVQKVRPLVMVSGSEASINENPVKQRETRPVNKARRGPAKAKLANGPVKHQKKPSDNPSLGAKDNNIPCNDTSCFSFNQMHNEDRRKALLLMLAASDEDFDHNTSCETYTLRSYTSQCVLVQEIFAAARSSLSEAWQKLCADSMQSVLTESAVALPSKYVSRVRNGRVSFLQGVGDKVNDSSAKVLGGSGSAGGLPDIVQLLQSAHKMVNTLLTQRHQHCPTDMVHALVKMEARISLLLTTMNQPFATSSTELVLKASQPKDDALDRERMVALAESATQSRSSLSMWPTLSSAMTAKQQAISAGHLDDLPSYWSVISLTLAEDNDELLVSKIISGRSPFLIRIPLRRSNEGDGSDDFVFDDARTEMRHIIEEANSSSHDVRGTADRTIRAQWHADREKLDRRLEVLLSNIESFWLGGFKGILSPNAHGQNQVRRFGEALNRSLGNHLPSRQKSGNSADESVEIHDHILEIFLGLGSSDEIDLDDAIMDLLYFVVDILQLSGERNAYDEIDWDAMLVDVIDALRACHKAQPQPARHTILVLDKELECFPWESLPCLIDHPVSRMPSLGSIFDRLSNMRVQQGRGDTLAISRSTVKACSIINPSGDLTSTQSLFEPILSSNLPAQRYTSLINTSPTESQFSSLLSASDILLYFGHGSGAQYIRGRNIRSLPKSAVTFLFGCSSAKMTEHGAFESTGMPRYYMLGNSPAVVGCLWDVTDREIDRVALKTISEWGLVDKDDDRVKEGLKKKGRKTKEKSKEVQVQKDKHESSKTLIEAVQEGRQACVLRYLCGAAVVVYGVPIVLTE